MKTAMRLAFGLLLTAALGFADLTPEQKTADFHQLAALYSKNYGPYYWKRDVIGFDALNLKPWLERVNATKTDLDFYEVCIDYVASLQDGHDVFTLESDYRARLGFAVDIYDGKTLIDSINRTTLPLAQYPFQIGDELVSVDGQSTSDIIQSDLKYQVTGYLRATQRLAAELIAFRVQSLMPHAHEIGDTANVVIRRQNGDLETYTLPWVKTGTALLNAGTPVSPNTSNAPRLESAEPGPNYLRALKQLWNLTAPNRPVGVLNFGSINPIFALPAGFTQRLGRGASDVYLSGTYQAGGDTIGFIRIPDFEPPDTTLALTQLQREVAFFQQNTDGLVIDVMRNPGGDVCYGEEIASFFMTGNWRPMGFSVRATQNWIQFFASALQQAKDDNAPQWVIDIYTAFLQEVQTAFSENRGMTGPLPLCGPTFDRTPAQNSRRQSIAYTKPLIVLTDEMSASAGDAFPAMLQDAQRGPIVGFRTMGLGGDVIDVDGTAYSGGKTRLTLSLEVRKNDIVTPDFPPAPFIENIGVRPDVPIDYMTMDNLLQRGKPFVDAFTNVIVQQINQSK